MSRLDTASKISLLAITIPTMVYHFNVPDLAPCDYYNLKPVERATALEYRNIWLSREEK